jgi:hypothetical protein
MQPLNYRPTTTHHLLTDPQTKLKIFQILIHHHSNSLQQIAAINTNFSKTTTITNILRN